MKKFITLACVFLSFAFIAKAETYTLVSDLSKLDAEDEIIIAAQKGTTWYAVQSGAAAGIEITVTDNTISTVPSGCAVFTIKASGNTDYPFALYNASQQKYIGNAAKSANMNSSATITTGYCIKFDNNATGGASAIQCNNNNSQKHLLLNSTTFKFYASSTSYGQPKAFKKVSTETYTVTFAGCNGTNPEAITEGTPGSGIVLPNAESTDDYKFIGWATTENATTANAGAAGDTYRPQSNCTLYAVYAKYCTVTIEQPENGTLVVKKGDDVITSGTKLIVGDVIEAEATPNRGYKLKNIQFVDASTHTNTVNFTFTLTDNVTVKANFDALTATNITYKLNNATLYSEKLYEGETLEYYTPTLTPGNDWEFCGWTTNSNYTGSTTAPEFYTAQPTEDITLYAVYKKLYSTSETTATLTNTDLIQKFGSSTASYGDQSITNSYGTWSGNFAFQGNQGGDGKYFIQIRNNSTTVSYVKVPDFDGEITSIVLGDVRNSNSSNYTGFVYFRATADNNATALDSKEVNNNNGNITFSDIPAKTSTGYIMSSAACRIYSITVNYKKNTYTYTLNLPEISLTDTDVFTLAEEMSIASVSYTRDIAHNEWHAVCVPFGVDTEDWGALYKVIKLHETQNEDGYAVFEYLSDTEDMEAGKPYLIKHLDESIATEIYLSANNATLVATPGVEGEGEDIALKGTFTEIKLTNSTEGNVTTTYYGLKDGEFRHGGNRAMTMKPFRAYLEVTASAQQNIKVRIAGETDGIDNVVAGAVEDGVFYNLQGVRVDNPKAGIYIFNGKKVMIK